jgi:hypothetical protein
MPLQNKKGNSCHSSWYRSTDTPLVNNLLGNYADLSAGVIFKDISNILMLKDSQKSLIQIFSNHHFAIYTAQGIK